MLIKLPRSAVLKVVVETLYRVAKCSLRVAKVYQDCPITLDLLKSVTLKGRRNFENVWKGSR
jgi:hypothetical protein